MKFSTHLVTGLILLIGMFSFLQAASIQGVVTDANTGLPVNNAGLTAIGFDPINPDSIIYRTFSATDGSYSFDNVVPATYYLWCEHNNYLSSSQSGIVILDSASSVTVNFSLTPNSGGNSNFVSGIVYSTSTILPAFWPLGGANVHLTGNGITITSVSDSMGLYSFTGIFPGLYYLSADAPGHYPAPMIDSLWIDVNTFITDLDIHLILSDSTTGSTSLSGYVYEADSTGAIGPPIYPAKISLYPTSPVYSQYYMTWTNPDGMHYLIDNIIPEIYDAICEAPGYLPEQVFNIDLSMGSATQDFHLLPDNTGGSAILSGYVYGDSINSFPLITVHPAVITVLGYTPMGDSLMYRVINNPNGSYMISGIVPGTYTVWCIAPGYQSQFVHNFVIADSVNQLDFNLTPVNAVQNGHILGNVFSDSSGAPVSGALIEFISMNGFNFNAVSDINGNYASPSLPVGDYYVACYVMSRDSNYFYMEYYDDAHSLASATILTVAPFDTIQGIDFGVPTSITTTNASVSGTVTDDNNLPLVNAKVSVWVTRNPGTFGDSLVFSSYTDAQGKYTINLTANVPMFTYSFIISANKSGYNIEFWQEKASLWEADRIWVFGDTTITGIDFTLDTFSSNNSISGTITSELRNTPIDNAFIIAADAVSGQIHFTFTDSVGYYNLSFLNSSNFYLLFTANGHVPEFYDDVYVWENATPVYATGSVTGIDASLTELTTNPSTGIISGTVIDDNNTPLSGVLLAIINSTGDVIGYDMTDNQGSYDVTGISNGNHQVSASKVSYTSETQNVTFNSSMHNTLIVNFDLNQTTTDLPENPKDQLPTKLELLSNYPNPFNPETKISINLPSPERVRLVIYNVLGQLVNEMINNELPAGTHTFIWNGTDIFGNTVSTGVYFYMLEVENRQIIKKMILSK